jgi:hypothetical protein
MIFPQYKHNQKYQGNTIGVFGLAKAVLNHGGGSASLNAHYRIKASRLHTATPSSPKERRRTVLSQELQRCKRQ